MACALVSLISVGREIRSKPPHSAGKRLSVWVTATARPSQTNGELRFYDPDAYARTPAHNTHLPGG